MSTNCMTCLVAPRTGPDLPDKLLHILQHSLGLDRYGRGRPYRNHYVPGGDDVPLCWSLAELGMMQEHPESALTDGAYRR